MKNTLKIKFKSTTLIFNPNKCEIDIPLNIDEIFITRFFINNNNNAKIKKLEIPQLDERFICCFVDEHRVSDYICRHETWTTFENFKDYFNNIKTIIL